MKYIKKFENDKLLPEPGDLILMKSYGISEVQDFISKNIGTVLNIIEGKIRVRYDNIPGNIDLFFHDNTRIFDIEMIITFGKTIEELEMRKITKKYNI